MEYVLVTKKAFSDLVDYAIKNAFCKELKNAVECFFEKEKLKCIDDIEPQTIKSLNPGATFYPKENVKPVVNEKGLIIGFFVSPIKN